MRTAVAVAPVISSARFPALARRMLQGGRASFHLLMFSLFVFAAAMVVFLGTVFWACRQEADEGEKNTASSTLPEAD